MGATSRYALVGSNVYRNRPWSLSKTLRRARPPGPRGLFTSIGQTSGGLTRLARLTGTQIPRAEQHLLYGLFGHGTLLEYVRGSHIAVATCTSVTLFINPAHCGRDCCLQPTRNPPPTGMPPKDSLEAI
jgi:hypothetical protein